jgi:exonuclease VII large subunit
LLRVRPESALEERRLALNRGLRRLEEQARRQLSDRRNRYSMLEARLRLLGPEQVLARG